MCMCDEPNNYLCFECECFYKDAVFQLIYEHKNEILEEGDWWWTINSYDINIHCQDDENFYEPDAVFKINLYKLDRPDGTSSYGKDVQWDLPPMTRKQIRLMSLDQFSDMVSQNHEAMTNRE